MVSSSRTANATSTQINTPFSAFMSTSELKRKCTQHRHKNDTKYKIQAPGRETCNWGRKAEDYYTTDDKTAALDKIRGCVHGETLVPLETTVIMLSDVFICPYCVVNRDVPLWALLHTNQLLRPNCTHSFYR